VETGFTVEAILEERTQALEDLAQLQSQLGELKNGITSLQLRLKLLNRLAAVYGGDIGAATNADNRPLAFACDICDRRFRTAQGRTMHKTRTHTL